MQSILTAFLSLLTISAFVQPGAASPPPDINIKVLLPDGSPAAGVEVGISIHHADNDDKGLSLEVSPADGKSLLTNSSGLITIDRKFFPLSDAQARPRVIDAINKDRTLVGFGSLTREAADTGTPLTITLAPACHIIAHLHSSEVEALGLPLKITHLNVWWGDLRPVGVENRKDGIHEFVLPPGDFKISAFGSNLATKEVNISIDPGELKRKLDIDIPASCIARLTGKPAPEFRSIKGWQNGPPVKLADLKGKVVLLDFWGAWCGPCVFAMPELMDLHEKYKDQGLVIIAIHDDSTESIATMNESLKFAREKVWNNRELPFLIALDGGGEMPIESDSDTARGATTAIYGISAFPTQVLIDRNGHVIGKRRPGADDPLLKLFESK